MRPMAVEVSTPWSSTTKSHAGALQALGQPDEMLQRSAQPVQFGHHQLIADTVGRQQSFVELRPAGQLPEPPCRGKNSVTTRRGERIALGLGVLVAGGDPRVADPGGRTVSPTPTS